MNIAVCDDSRLDRELITELIHHYFKDRHMDYDVARFCNGRNFLYDIEEGAEYDVLMLDIYIGSILGIDIASRARKLGYNGDIIFLSASPEFVYIVISTAPFNIILTDNKN